MAARKASESGESGSISTAERSDLGEKKAKIESVTINKLFAEQQQRNKSSRTEENRTPVSPRPGKDPLSSDSPRSSVARDSKVRAREKTRRSPASATLEESGRKSESTKPWKRRRLESQPKFKTKSEANASLLGVAIHYIYIYTLVYNICKGMFTTALGQEYNLRLIAISYLNVDYIQGQSGYVLLGTRVPRSTYPL